VILIDALAVAAVIMVVIGSYGILSNDAKLARWLYGKYALWLFWKCDKAWLNPIIRVKP
jgi:hypothetical protein